VSDEPVTFVVNSRGKVTWVGGADITEDTVRAAVRGARD